MEIKDLMNPSVVTIEPTASAALAARLLSRHNVGSLPVCGEDRRLRGMDGVASLLEFSSSVKETKAESW